VPKNEGVTLEGEMKKREKECTNPHKLNKIATAFQKLKGSERGSI